MVSLKASFARGLAGVALLVACGSSYPESEYPPAPPPGVTLAEDDGAPAPPGALWRKDVNAVLDEGLGRFLQRVALEPEVQQSAFVGFRVVELKPPEWWQGVDILPGDIVTLVNGMPIEKPTEAHDAFESLRKSDKLTVKYLRAGEARELTYSIVDKPAASTKPASTKPTSEPPAAPKPAS